MLSLNTSNIKLNVLFTLCSEISPKKLYIAKGESAASHHYWRTEDKDYLIDMETFKGLCVLLPNAETIAVDEKGSLPLSDKLSKKKKTAL